MRRLCNTITAAVLTAAVALLTASLRCRADDGISVIPIPAEVTLSPDSMTVPQQWHVHSPAGSEPARRVTDYLAESCPVVPVEAGADLTLVICDTLPDQAYRLTVGKDGAVISSAPSGSGWFYGLQTLMQMILAADNGRIPGVTVSDRPRFAWRGVMMDHARWFLGVDETIRMIDLMALYKLNVLHLHLTDDQGWRFGSERYPRLTQVGAWRPYTQVGHSDDSVQATFDGMPHGGYFTKDDLRRIIRHAESRFVTVVPEIEMPGHASAALASYPEYSCGLGKHYIVQPEFDVFDEVFCPTDSTLAFLCGVLDEVMEIFPSEYIHIGGDECPKKAWAVCPRCQARIAGLGLSGEEALQGWMIGRISEHVASRGRRIIGWDEILEGGIAPGAAVMSWRGSAGGVQAALMGHQAVMSPQAYCYFDYYQEDPEGAPLAMGGFTPVDSVYLYDPVPPEVPDSLRHMIIGVQGNVWGEYIPDPAKFEYMAFPRLIALSEVQWSYPERKSLPGFRRRLIHEFDRLDSLGVRAFRPDYISPRLRFADSVFTVVQMTDLHLMPSSGLCDVTEETIRSIVAREKPDLALLTGDVVTGEPHREGWERIVRLFDGLRLPFAVMPGNHDGEYIAKPELYDYLTSATPMYVGQAGPQGNGDCVIEVSGSDGSPAALLYCLDSNDYQPYPELGHYDWIHFDQICWYRSQSAAYTARNGGRPLPALAFFHIPLIEYADVVDLPATYGRCGEGAGAPGGMNSGMFASLREMGDVMGVFAGHDHDNDYIGMSKGLALGFGRVTGAGAYGEPERGARIIRLYQGDRRFDTWIATPSGNEPPYYYPSGINGAEEDSMVYLPALDRQSEAHGIDYEYYEGLIKHTSQIDTARLVRAGVMDNFDITGAPAEDHFAYKFHTLIDIPDRGVYIFYTRSDDGSVLMIDGVKVVDNDGGHSARTREGRVALEPGLHRLDLLYFENYMGQELEVGYASRLIPAQPIPSSRLYRP